jgi:hypothetical protein
MEKRPDEQRWVDKARTELEALEAMQRSGAAGKPSGKIDDRDGERRVELDRELERDGVMPLVDQDDLIDPFGGRVRVSTALRDPWTNIGEDGLIDPFQVERVPQLPESSEERRALRAYGAALAEFRRALNRQVEDVSSTYERGIAFAMVDDGKAAVRTWDSVRMIDARVDAARRGVEKLRSTLRH